MTTLFPQLPLGLQLDQHCRFDNFIGDGDALAPALVEQQARSAARPEQVTAEPQLFLWGEADTGKTHLLQAACVLASRQGATVCYFDAEALRQNGPALLDGLEQLALVCLDELDAWLAVDGAERALFDLINRVREQGARLLLAARASPRHLALSLPDLVTRLAWGPVLQLRPLEDAGKLRVLRQQAEQRGLRLSEPVARYLMQHYPRRLGELLARLDQLDRAAMASQRPITIPLIKAVFGQE